MKLFGSVLYAGVHFALSCDGTQNRSVGTILWRFSELYKKFISYVMNHNYRTLISWQNTQCAGQSKQFLLLAMYWNYRPEIVHERSQVWLERQKDRPINRQLSVGTRFSYCAWAWTCDEWFSRCWNKPNVNMNQVSIL